MDNEGAAKSMENPEWFEFYPIFNASKNRTYRESVTRKCTFLMEFFVKNSLLKINPLNENGIIRADLKIYKNDLTGAGQFLFTSGAVYKWLNYTDRGGKIENFRHLEKALREYETCNE